MAGPCGGAARAFVERAAEIGFRGAQSGSQAEEQSCQRRDAKREAEHPQIGFDFERDILRQESEQRVRPPASEHQPQRAAQSREQKTFGQQLAHQSEAACAQRGNTE